LSVNHPVEVQFTAASKSKMLSGVSQYFGIRGVFKRSHEYEQRSHRLLTGATDYFCECFDLFSTWISVAGLRRLRECIGNFFACIGAFDESSKPWIVCLQRVADNRTRLCIDLLVV